MGISSLIFGYSLTSTGFSFFTGFFSIEIGSESYIKILSMTGKNDLLYFDDDEGQPAKGSNKMTKNFLLADEEEGYQEATKPKSVMKTSFYKQEKKEQIYEPGGYKKGALNLPTLKKNTLEVRRQIKLDSEKKQLDKKPAKSSDEEDEVVRHDNRQNNRKESDDIEDISLSPKQQKKRTPIKANIFEEEQKKEVKKQSPEPARKQSSNEQDSNNVEPSSTLPPTEPLTAPKIITIEDILDRKAFIQRPVPEGRILMCTIKRDKGALNMYPQYDLYLSNEYRYLMTAKKRSGNATSNYLISSDKNDLEPTGPNYMGKVRSNFMGTNFQIYDAGCNPEKKEPGKQPRRILSSVHYASNIFGSKGPRKMYVYLSDPAKQPKLIYQKDLKQHWQADKDNFVELNNKPPKWNEQKQIYMLDFKGRVDKPSVKNFILTFKDQEEPLILLFGRVGQDVFHLDVMYPLSPLQAFGIVITSFDTKLACQ